MKKFLALVLAALMVFALVACGGQSDPEKKDVVKVNAIKLTDEDYAFGVDKDQPELLEKVNAFIEKIMNDGTFDAVCDKYFADGTPEAVKSAEEDNSKDQLVIATNAEFKPFEYKEGDSFYGVDMEIAALLAKELGMELVIKDMKFEAVCLSVGQHKCDIAMAGLTVNEERKESVTFSTPYYKAAQHIIVKADDTTFEGITDVKGLEEKLKALDPATKIGFQTGTTGEFYVKGDEDWGFDGLNVEGKGYDNGALAVQDMLNGNLDFVIIDEAPANAIAATYNAK